ncbi:cecropin-C type 1-like [Anoplophora glabripennis]|uniref:cecropin-C type 1-like n=1 Tax=Anoplophora glabripennis TaxID=217634 RepID=UPI00087591F2|nr:cecropin-C type 1-like [Anoplophora glabripennis]
MKLTIIFVLALTALLALAGQAEGKNFFKQLEKVGQNVRNAAERSLPTVVGYAAVAKQVGK